MTLLKASVDFRLRHLDAVSLKSIQSKRHLVAYDLHRVDTDIRSNTSNTATYIYKTESKLLMIDGVLSLTVLS